MRTAWTFAGLIVLSVAATTAGAADRFVATAGSDAGNNCLTATTPCATVSHATSQASSGDTINVASGSYRDNIRIQDSATLAFLGGWDATFTSRNALGTPSVLRGGRVPTALRHRDRVWGIFADAGAVINVTIDGFALEKGQAGTDAAPDVGFPTRTGGGLAAVASDGSSIALRINNTFIMQNRDEYGGAGLSVWAFGNSSIDAALDGVRVLKNRSFGSGGILAISPEYAGGPGTVSLQLTNCVIAGNEGSDFGGGIGVVDQGVVGSSVTVDVVSSTITQNTNRGPRVLTPGSPPPDAFGGGGIGAGGFASPAPVTVSLSDTILFGNLLHGVGAGTDFLQPSNSISGQVTVNATYSDIGQVVLNGGTFNDLGGNVAVEPMLDAAYELLSGSPLINAGTCTGAPSTDFEGDPRPSGAGCDIGADEFQF